MCLLHERTLELYFSRPRTLTVKKIAKDTGLTKAWIADFAQYREALDPGVNKVETLYTYLNKAPLKV